MLEARPFPIIVGCGRSGTTLVRTLVDSHPDVAVPGESYFVADLARQRHEWERPGGFAWEAFLDTVLAHEWVGRWHLDRERVVNLFRDRPPDDYSAAVRLVFAAYAAQQGKSRYGDKTPGYVVTMARLAALFPEARFVHVVRDGRDTALALLATSWGPRTIEAAARYWRTAVLAGHRYALANPDRCIELRYEGLVADPEGELRSLCAFLDLPFDPAMLDHRASAEQFLAMSPFPQHHGRLHLPPSPGLRDWRTQMAPADAALFDALAGDALRALGYPMSAGWFRRHAERARRRLASAMR